MDATQLNEISIEEARRGKREIDAAIKADPFWLADHENQMKAESVKIAHMRDAFKTVYPAMAEGVWP